MDLLRAPWVLGTVVVSAIWYWRGSRRPSLRALGTFSRRRVVPWRGLCFATGLVAVLVALDSPLERLADDWFWAHMLQHVLLMMVAAPLLVLGAPWMPFWRPLPLQLRRRLARALVKSPLFSWLRRLARVLATPVAAWLLFDVNLAVWHVPALYDLTLRNSAVHYAEHVSFVLLGLLFWSQVLNSPPFHPRLNAFGRVIYTAAGAGASWLLAIVLTFATTPFYPAQSAGHRGGLSALADQQLAAGVMLGPGSIPYAIVVFYWLYVWLGADNSVERRRVDHRHSALGTGAR
ncbi:MAG: putative rane protein [Gaiellaceae bacterium]|nr:putative rane protein [Gaiellaceae bacterium]